MIGRSFSLILQSEKTTLEGFSMSFFDILSAIRKKSFSEHDKGYRFEKLMKSYLLTDPLYANSLTEVWLWNDFPFRQDFSGKDTGIDLVAKTSTGDYWRFSVNVMRKIHQSANQVLTVFFQHRVNNFKTKTSKKYLLPIASGLLRQITGHKKQIRFF